MSQSKEGVKEDGGKERIEDWVEIDHLSKRVRTTIGPLVQTVTSVVSLTLRGLTLIGYVKEMPSLHLTDRSAYNVPTQINIGRFTPRRDLPLDPTSFTVRTLSLNEDVLEIPLLPSSEDPVSKPTFYLWVSSEILICTPPLINTRSQFIPGMVPRTLDPRGWETDRGTATSRDSIKEVRRVLERPGSGPLSLYCRYEGNALRVCARCPSETSAGLRSHDPP